MPVYSGAHLPSTTLKLGERPGSSDIFYLQQQYPLSVLGKFMLLLMPTSARIIVCCAIYIFMEIIFVRSNGETRFSVQSVPLLVHDGAGPSPARKIRYGRGSPGVPSHKSRRHDAGGTQGYQPGCVINQRGAAPELRGPWRTRSERISFSLAAGTAPPTSHLLPTRVRVEYQVVGGRCVSGSVGTCSIPGPVRPGAPGVRPVRRGFQLSAFRMSATLA